MKIWPFYRRAEPKVITDVREAIEEAERAAQAAVGRNQEVLESVEAIREQNRGNHYADKLLMSYTAKTKEGSTDVRLAH